MKISNDDRDGSLPSLNCQGRSVLFLVVPTSNASDGLSINVYPTHDARHRNISNAMHNIKRHIIMSVSMFHMRASEHYTHLLSQRIWHVLNIILTCTYVNKAFLVDASLLKREKLLII